MKGNPFFGTMRGKLGEQVFMRTGGEQRARTYLKVISNPRTKAQMSQRVKLANLVGFYRILRPLLGDSFLRRPANQSSYNAFVKANLASSRVYLTKEQASSGYVVTAPYTITDGTLQPSGWEKITAGLGSTYYITPFEGTSGAGYTLQAGFKNAYLAYYSDADESDVLLFVLIKEQSEGIAPTMSIHPMYISQLDGTDEWFTQHIVSTKPAETTDAATYQYETAANETLVIVRARISNNRMVVCSTESLALGVSANLRLGQYNTQLALNSAINSYGLGQGFAIQKAVHNAPISKSAAYWVMENGSLSDTATFGTPGGFTAQTAIAYFSNVEKPQEGYNDADLFFENQDMNKEGSEIELESVSFDEEQKSMLIKFKSAKVTSSYNQYPVTTRIYMTLYNGSGDVIYTGYTAPLTFNAAQ